MGNRVGVSGDDDPSTNKHSDEFTQTNTYNLAGQLEISSTIRPRGRNKYQAELIERTYDAAGNMTHRAVTTGNQKGYSGKTNTDEYAYDEEHRLVSITDITRRKPKTELERTYDALGRVTTETAWNTTTAWTHDGLNPIQSDHHQLLIYLRNASGELLGEKGKNNGSIRWYVTDLLGSVTTATDRKGNRKGSPVQYSDYGVTTDYQPYKFGYTSERRDLSGNQLQHFYARTYDPSGAAWLQADLYRGVPDSPATLNRYTFVSSAPSTATDVLGFATLRVERLPTNVRLEVTTESTYTGTLEVTRGPNPGPSLQGGPASALQRTYNPQQTAPASLLQPAAGIAALYGRQSRKDGAERAMLSVVGSYDDYVSTSRTAPGAPWSPQFRDSVGRASNLAYGLYDHYMWGNGATYVLDWSLFRNDPSFTSAAMSGQTLFSHSADTDLFWALGTFTVRPLGNDCFEIYDRYDFRPDKISNLPYLAFWAYQLGGAREFDVVSQGCIPTSNNTPFHVG